VEPPLVIEHRDALVYMLCEAAELEHAICCQYLYAGFSLKQADDPSLELRQRRAVAKWRHVVFEVATQEMLHLATVNNLLSAIGAAPRVGRPNLPATGRHYPAAIQLALVPFSERALRHFLYLERPEGITLQDAEGFEALREAEPLMSDEDIVPRPQEFATIGHLYRSIEEGFRHLAERHGEDWLFIGPPRAQARPETFRWDDLVPVSDLKSAMAAIEVVVEQGEGSRGHWRDSHYGMFLEVLGEFLTLRREDPSFEPASPVQTACVRLPVDSTPGLLVTDPVTARVLDAFNVTYEVILYLLAHYFGHHEETTDAEIEAVADVAVTLMVTVLMPLGEIVTRMPIGPEHPGATAGPSFEIFYGSGYLLPHKRAAWILMHERLLEVGSFLGYLTTQGAPSELEGVRLAVGKAAERLEREMPELADREVAAPRAWVGTTRRR
jgi:hypothetical protein